MYFVQTDVGNTWWCENPFNNDQSSILIGGDLNAHHPYWASNKTDKTGAYIFNSHNSNLILLNDKSFTTPSIYQHQSILDLIFVAPCLYSLLLWEVLKGPIGSDHFPTLAKFDWLGTNKTINT